MTKQPVKRSPADGGSPAVFDLECLDKAEQNTEENKDEQKDQTN